VFFSENKKINVVLQITAPMSKNWPKMHEAGGFEPVSEMYGKPAEISP
jgi:hypothetical protein